MLYNSRRKRRNIRTWLWYPGLQESENGSLMYLPHEQSFDCFVISFNEAKNVEAIGENERNITHVADINLHFLFGPQDRMKSCSV